MTLETLLPFLLPAIFVAALVLERVSPGTAQPRVRFWILKGVLFFVLSGAINALVPAFVAARVTERVHPVDLQRFGIVVGAIAVIVVSEVLSYAVHRSLHRWNALWRWTHQMHHSAERLDVAGAFYFHPFDVVVQTGIPTLGVCLLGVAPEAAALAGLTLFLVGVFQHLNVRTPRWLGYVVIRPEAHSVHHARGVHAYNYGNFAFMDLLLGTFRNPEGFTEDLGFWDGASSKVGAMLLGRDVGRPR